MNGLIVREAPEQGVDPRPEGFVLSETTVSDGLRDSLPLWFMNPKVKLLQLRKPHCPAQTALILCPVIDDREALLLKQLAVLSGV